MPDITLHNLDDATYTAIRNAAEAEDLSLNQVIKRVIRKAAQDKTFGLPVACEPVAVYDQEPNLHLAIDPDLLAKARSKAAERGTSLLRLVFDSLAAFVEGSVEPPRRVLGTWKGLVHMAPDFNELPADIAEAFGMENGGGEMKLLLDTHVFLWSQSDPKRLSNAERDAIGDSRNAILLSAATAWEIEIKRQLGKLDVPMDWMERASGFGVQWLDVRPDHIRALQDLPPIHRDPFDRILVAQSFVENARLLSHDPLVLRYLANR